MSLNQINSQNVILKKKYKKLYTCGKSNKIKMFPKNIPTYYPQVI